MPNIKPVSDLRNYAKVLEEVHEGEPVYLTKNGRGTYAIIDIRDQESYVEFMARKWLMAELEKGWQSAKDEGWLSKQDIEDLIKKKWGMEK